MPAHLSDSMYTALAEISRRDSGFGIADRWILALGAGGYITFDTTPRGTVRKPTCAITAPGTQRLMDEPW